MASILREFDKIWKNFRHGIVHSNAVLRGKNGLKLGIEQTGTPIKINISYSEIQEGTSVCTNLVTSFNTELLREMVTRLAADWRKIITIVSSNENALFNKTWEILYSRIDAKNRLISTRMRKCRHEVKREFHLP
jgi:hypothetical protein